MWHREVDGTFPFIIDLFLAGECVTAVIPIANLSWQVLVKDITLQVANETNLLRPLYLGPLSSKNAVGVLRWCASVFVGVPSVAVHLRVPGAHACATLTRDRDEKLAGVSPRRGVAACTVFQDWGEFAIWSLYLLAIGVEHVVGYYNGGPIGNSSFPTPYSAWPKPLSPDSAVTAHVNAAAALVSAGKVTLYAWTIPYRLFRRGDPPETQLYANAACLNRYFPRFSSILLMDTDEFLVVNSSLDLGARNLTALFSGNKCFRMKATFASSGYNLTATPTEMSAMSFSAAGAWRDANPVKNGYEKFALRNDAQPWYSDPHGHPDCNREHKNPDKFTFLHITNWRRHDSFVFSTTKDVGRVSTTALADTLAWAEGN